ncbi:hypothetical protein A0H81_04113 [Grifola frondosa]|uniref:Tf2-1-like SH3-like domain-containing protein n=1 Tax=Grifola frondosa TaxID=5627 RepID=A0A1C7MGE1_GRIFR|nr:hypothetical protein A0H81_04113 [Grifola frondosa]
MIWEGAGHDEYPGIRAYAQHMKAAIVAVHNSILASRVKQMRDVNHRHYLVLFAEKDLMYISTKNISLPKGLVHKLAPKFIGPYTIIRDFGNNSYQIALPTNLKQHGIHDVFHTSLLWIHELNDDCLFSGRLDSQVAEFEDQEGKWAIDKIVAHRGSRNNSIFEAIWKSGDRTWIPYATIVHLPILRAYFEVLDISEVSQLMDSDRWPPPNDLQVFLGILGALCRAGHCTYKRTRHTR